MMPMSLDSWSTGFEMTTAEYEAKIRFMFDDIVYDELLADSVDRKRHSVSLVDERTRICDIPDEMF
jgi:hypothetical protein